MMIKSSMCVYFMAGTMLLILSCTPRTLDKLKSSSINRPTELTNPVFLDYLEAEPLVSEQKGQSATSLNWKDPTNSRQFQRIDVTTFKNGFQSNQFYSVVPFDKESQIHRIKKFVLAPNLTRSIDSMQIRKEEFLENGASNLELDGLVPGMNYYVRICHFDLQKRRWIPSQTIKFRAPIFPFDEVKN